MPAQSVAVSTQVQAAEASEPAQIVAVSTPSRSAAKPMALVASGTQEKIKTLATQQCLCKGWCDARTSVHMGTWSKSTSRGCCMSEALPGLTVCNRCKCGHEDCGNFSRGASKFCYMHSYNDLCLELQMVV